MSLKFNINRPKISDEEIARGQDFDNLVRQFKEQSLKQARGDESWWNNKKIRYSTVIAGVTVICTITYFALFKEQKQNTKTNETVITQKKEITDPETKDIVQNSTEKPRELAAKPEAKRAFVYAPSQKLKTPYNKYKINNAKGGEIVHTTSSKIKIPKNSFVDKNGKDIIGDVTIEYKEYHDAADIIASGIPMAYDSAGTRYNLESAGMFDIRGYQDETPVFIKPDKKVQIELASSSNEKRFNQYYLDTVAGNWQYIKKDQVVTKKSNETPVLAKTQCLTRTEPYSQRTEQLKTEIEKVIPKRIDSVKTVYRRKIEKLPLVAEPYKPAKANPARPNFLIESTYEEYPELAAFNNVLFEVGNENKNYNPALHEITWNDLKISQGPVKGKNYLLTMIHRNRVEKLIVYPVLNEVDYVQAAAQYEKKFEIYQALANKRAAEEKQLLAEMEAKQAAYLAEKRKKEEEYEIEKAKISAQYYKQEQNNLASNFNSMSNQVRANRIFDISRFGIFNSDCPHAYPKAKTVVPIFVSADKDRPLSSDQVYLIDHTNKQVFMLDRSTGFKLSIDNNVDYSLCMFSKDQLFLCDKNTFKQILENESNKFRVTSLGNKADNLVDFKKALGI